MISFALPARAEEPSLKDLLRDGLYAEEVSRDPEAAARQYEHLLARHAEQNAIAATALFRLAEVRRKQERKDEAIQLYQQLLAEFPQADPQAKLARENLTAMGGKAPAAEPAEEDPEAMEIARLRNLLLTSPDRARDPKELREAVTSNMPKVVRFLLESGVKTEGSRALENAASDGYLEILKILLSHAKEQVANHGGKALAEAVLNGRTEVVRTLLLAKVDVNWQPDSCALPSIPLTFSPARVGTPLMNSIEIGNSELTALLLESGADVKLAANGTGYTALHLAAGSLNKDAPALVERLIELGADVNALSKQPPSNRPFDHNVSPLQLAVTCHAWDCAKALIRHGADLKQPELFSPFCQPSSSQVDLSKVKFLLENGADPNIPCGAKKLTFGQGYEGVPFVKDVGGQTVEFPSSLLFLASKNPDSLDMLRLLLTKGAKAGPALGSIVNAAAKQDEDGSVVKLLLEQRPATVNLDDLPHTDQWKPAARKVFLEEVVYPALAKEPGCHLFSVDHGYATLSGKPAAAETAYSTAALLLNNRAPLLSEVPTYSDGGTTKGKAGHWPDSLTLLRAKSGGGWDREKLDLTGTEPLPAIRQGDILELVSQEQPAKSDERYEALDGKLEWHLRKRISFPVTVEIAGKSREILLRGDRLVFDPTLPEAPLVGAGKLMDLLWQPESFNAKSEGTVVVTRKDWPEVKRALKDLLVKDFELLPGDHLKLELPAGEGGTRKPSGITLTTDDDIPFACYFRTLQPELTANADNPPQLTLVQALTHAVAPTGIAKPLQPDVKDLPAWLIPQLGANPQRILPHPDLSKLRIRRDGKIIEVDLEKVIAVPPEQMSVAQARQADVELESGDIIEVPIHRDRLKTVWKGFTPQEEAFFAKALDCKITVIDTQGNIQMKTMEYHQPSYVESTAGVIALPPATGTATMLVSAVSGLSRPGDAAGGTVARDNTQLSLLSDCLVFAREGDALVWKNSNIFSQPRQPRPRVVPPSPQAPNNNP